MQQYMYKKIACNYVSNGLFRLLNRKQVKHFDRTEGMRFDEDARKNYFRLFDELQTLNTALK